MAADGVRPLKGPDPDSGSTRELRGLGSESAVVQEDELMHATRPHHEKDGTADDETEGQPPPEPDDAEARTETQPVPHRQADSPMAEQTP